MTKQPHLLVMAGGTGGHVFPGLAVAKLLAEQGWTVTWLGTAERMEAQLVPKHGFAIEFLDVKGVRGNGIVRKLALPWTLLKAVMQAIKLLRRLKPDVVLGMGGFASGPGGIAARLLGLPLVIHEQNAVVGMTNQWLSKVASRTLQAFPGAFGPREFETVVGNPVRRDVIEAGAAPREFTEHLNLLVVGGSLGAAALNEKVPQALAQLGELPVTVRHQVGRGNFESVAQRYAELGIENAEVSEFIDDMAAAYRWADLVVCRSGALTVSEVAAAGVPAIFVPYPHAVDDHQTKNAYYLVENGAAQLLPQSELNAQRLSAMLIELFAAARREPMAVKARELAILDATEQVAQVCRELSRRDS
jgi:UDP-N-acetylglucosamine--N-acetylmuramyl-(pentapeptide) pyrophosphoryl-undecaprenol N-acetylglucosamine transferase